jgi:hypothetical protein
MNIHCSRSARALRYARWLVLSTLMIVGNVTCALAATLTPPSTQFVDKFGVNLLNGQVNSTQETVSIGGPMGLSHGISLYTNHFLRPGQRGYIDKYAGQSKYSQLLGPGFIWPIMRVHDFSGSVDFRIKVGGSFYAGDGRESATTASFVALKDTRNQLIVSGASNEYLDWIKPDGTVTRFLRASNPRIDADGRLLQVMYPNGFRIEFDYLNRVFTNTGYTLIYQYEQDVRPPDPVADANAPAGAPFYSISEWALHNPRYVKAVNSAVCSAGSAACLQRAWPTATFTWPPGMPRTMYIGKRTFTVDTPGGRTIYEYEPYDLAKNGNVIVSGYTAGQRISPRLKSIKPASSLSATLEYTYKNLFVYTSVGLRDDLFGVQYAPPAGTFPSGMGDYAALIQDAGVIESAKRIDERNSYEMGQVYMNESSAQNVGLLTGGVWRVITAITATPPMITSVDTLEEQVLFEASERNFTSQIRRQTGVTDVLAYTPRGNLKSITSNGLVTARAAYAYENDCATLPKSCNGATSTFDAKSNETRYEYHAASGQVQRVIPPADPNGKVAQVRYEYQPLRARYFDQGGNWVEGSPIYMKTVEKHCHDSNFASPDPTATCSGGDDVVTKFNYNQNNLQLTSVSTTSGGKTLRTCYQYDLYGNKLGQTQPKGAASCN